MNWTSERVTEAATKDLAILGWYTKYGKKESFMRDDTSTPLQPCISHVGKGGISVTVEKED